MVGSSFWRVTVVLSVGMLLGAIVFRYPSVTAQPVTQRRVTVSYIARPLEEVISGIASAEGLHVIYSPDKIDITVPVSLVARNKKLEEVLIMLEQETNLSLTLQDHHIIIKPQKSPLVGLTAVKMKDTPLQKMPVAVSEDIPPDTLLITAVDREGPSHSLFELRIHRDRDLECQLTKFNVLFDSSRWKELPAVYAGNVNPNNRHRRWFISGGVLANDYSAGLELQAGLSHIYLVFSPSWLSDAAFHGAYGIGTNIALHHNIAINPIYSFSTLHQHRTFSSTFPMPMPVSFDYKTTTLHHQFKLMLQYDLSPTIRVALGPTANYALTSYEFAEGYGQRFIVSDARLNRWRTVNGAGTGTYTTSSQVRTTPPSTTSAKYWLGWEATLSYKMNLWQRR